MTLEEGCGENWWCWLAESGMRLVSALLKIVVRLSWGRSFALKGRLSCRGPTLELSLALASASSPLVTLQGPARVFRVP